MKVDSLRPCPSSPNCVCSIYSDDKPHFIEPLPWRSELEANQQLALIKNICQSHFHIEVIQEEPTYLHLVFITRLLHFRDDVEFVLDTSQHCVHVRSASRTGHSDFGTNRRRVEKIRTLLQA